MIRKVTVFINACLILKLAGPGGASGPGGFDEASAGPLRWRRAGLPRGHRRRRSLGRYLGANTAAPPIIKPGINVISTNARPAAITPMVAAAATRSCPGLTSLRAEAEVEPARSDPRSTS